MDNFFAGHSHGPTPHLIDGCPLCDAAKAARNQAINHLSEALNLLSHFAPDGERPTLRLNLAPINVTADDTSRCHSIDLTAKQAEALSDAVDSMNAYASSEPPIDSALRDLADSIKEAVVARPGGVLGERIGSGEWSAAAVAQNDRELYAEVTDFFDSIDPISLLDDVLNSDRPGQAAEAYEQMTGEWDGDL
jgi:hypothetical protein